MVLEVDILIYEDDSENDWESMGIKPKLEKTKARALIEWSTIKICYENRGLTLIEMKIGDEVLESTTCLDDIKWQLCGRPLKKTP